MGNNPNFTQFQHSYLSWGKDGRRTVMLFAGPDSETIVDDQTLEESETTKRPERHRTLRARHNRFHRWPHLRSCSSFGQQ